MKVDNAIILAAGTSSRFAPLSYETHKALIRVKGEVLIERQIEQLLDAGIKDIFVVTGYKAILFEYLRDKYGVCLISNPDYLTRNNNGSIWVARNVLNNSYICSADNYFTINPFESDVDESYYAALYSEGTTDEWCMSEDENGYIGTVTIGGRASWYMLGHTFWSDGFSKDFLKILISEYELPETAGKLWESIFMAHLDVLKMRIRRYDNGDIYEFDTLDELRDFDESYKYNTRSKIIKQIATKLGIEECGINCIHSVRRDSVEAIGFEFCVSGRSYRYSYLNESLIEI